MLDKIIILDMDSYGSIAIAKRLRAQQIFCKILPGSAGEADIRKEDPRGVIWVGSDNPAFAVDPETIQMGLPILAIGAASHRLAQELGAGLEGVSLKNAAETVTYTRDALFENVSEGERWFPLAERIELPTNLTVIAKTEGFAAGFRDRERPLYGLQFTIESNDPDGLKILTNFCLNVCQCTEWWSPEAFIERTTADIARFADGRRVVCALSGGVDSGVCAMLAHRAVGAMMTPVYIDGGLSRTDNDTKIEMFCRNKLKMECVKVNARQAFLDNLKGVSDQERKIAVVQDTYRHAFEDYLGGETPNACMILGTNYSEVLSNPKNRDNYRHVPDSMPLIEPLVELFKDEVRAVGELLELPAPILHAQPFPMSGLASRINGAVSENLLTILRAADSIFSQEVDGAGQDRRLRLYYATLEAFQGVAVVLHAFTSGDKSQSARLPFDLLAKVAERIAAEVPGVGNVYYDVTAR